MSDLATLSKSVLIKANKPLLRVLVRLCKFGDKASKEKALEANTFKERAEAAKIRLDALKLWSSITHGTKNHGPVKIDEETLRSLEQEEAIKSFRALPEEERERHLKEAVENDEMTEKEADKIRRQVGAKLRQDAGAREPTAAEADHPRS